MPTIQPVNRPPAIDLSLVEPAGPFASLNAACPEQAQPFSVRIRELDTEQTLQARWFWDYDYSDPDATSVYPLQDYPIPPVTQDAPDRTVRLTRDFGFEDRTQLPPLGSGPVHTLELFVVERDALVDDTSQTPRFRALKNCSVEPWSGEAGCVSSHPAVFRWTVVVKDAASECLP